MGESEYRTVRSHVLFAMRAFFQERNFIEVETPSLASALIPERHIAVYSTQDEAEKQYLIPSPEVHLKPLLAKLYAEKQREWRLYEFAHSFRREELCDAIHANEFLMLEWYCVNASTAESRNMCVELLQRAVHAGASQGAPLAVWKNALLENNSITLCMRDAFRHYAGVDLQELTHAHSLCEARRIAGMPQQSNQDTYDWEDIFHAVFVERVEPHLPRDALVFIRDYPHRVATLAQRIDDSPWADRWELYIDGVEIANCYREENDFSEIQSFFKSQVVDGAAQTRARKENAPSPKQFLHAPSLPPCSGVALGVDRLMMLLCGKNAI